MQLSQTNLDTAYALYEDVLAINVTYDGQPSYFENLCYKRGSDCWKSNILEIFSYTPANWDTQAKIDAAVNAGTLSDTSGFTVALNSMAGGMTYDGGGQVTAAAALKFSWFLENNRVKITSGDNKGKLEDERAWTWEEQFLEIPEGSSAIPGVRDPPRSYSPFSIFKLSSRSFGDEFGGAIRGDLIMVNVSMFALIIYCSIMLGQCRPGKTRVALAILGVMTVGMAIGASMGICSALGLFYSPLASVLPFLLLGLGVDDMFVIAISYDITDPNLPIPERLGRCLAHAGSSIMVTSLTDFLAFLIGGTTSLPALRMFCFYAAVGILFILFLQVFLFSAMLAIDERFKADKMNDMACCCSGCPCTECPCNGIPIEDAETGHSTCVPGEVIAAPVYPESIQVEGSGSALGKGSGNGSIDIDQQYRGTNCCGLQVGLLRRFMQNVLGPFLTSTHGMFIALTIFTVVFVVGVVGASMIKEDADYRDFMPAGSYVIDFIDIDEKYFVTVGTRVGLYTSAVNYQAKHAEMQALYDGIQASYTVIGSTLVSWEKEFYDYEVANGVASPTEAAWYTSLNTWLSGAGSRFRGDIKFLDDDSAGSTTNYIVAARMILNHRMCTDSSCEVDNMKTLRRTVDAITPKLGGSPTPFPFGEEYLNFEQYATIEDEAKRNVGLSFLAIFIITMIMIPHPVVALLVFSSVVATIIEVIGYMYWWGLKIDGVTVVMLIVAIGLAIDYSAHIGVAYLHSTHRTNEQAVIHALADMGTPVFHGAMSTFIAIVVLAGSASYVFSSFFRQLFLATTLGCGHGLLVLPVLLTLLAPTPNGKEPGDSTVVQEASPVAKPVGQPIQGIEMKEMSLDQK